MVKHSHDCVFHTLMDLSFDPEASQQLSGEKSTLHTASLCPFSVVMQSPVLASQILMEPSKHPDAIHSLFGEYAVVITEYACPCKVRYRRVFVRGANDSICLI